MTWGKKGREIASLLEGMTDQDSIKFLGQTTIQEIKSAETPDKRTNALKMVSREILKKFPRRDSETDCYYHDLGGKSDLSKWRHLIFKYLTLDSADWDSLSLEDLLTKQPTEQLTEQQTEQNQLTIEDMTIQGLDLDTQTQEILESALEQSGMALTDFIKQAVRVYAKTITGKSKKHSEDLSTVPTENLLKDPTYSTHPGRAEELTKRAIKAIKYYNANIATEKADRWCITQSAIASLTGSRASTVGKVLEQFKDDIESHNQTYELDNYSNRKRGKPSIEETINLTELTPDGLD